jgi:cobalamin biosynthesis protein CbiD
VRLCFKQTILGFTVTAAAAAAAAAAAVMLAIDGGDTDVNPAVNENPQSGAS